MEEMKKLVLMDMQLNGAAEREYSMNMHLIWMAAGEMQVQAYTEIMDRMKELAVPIRGEAAAEEWGFYFSLHAGLLFLEFSSEPFFIMATVLIIYYKQVTEGYDDKIRFEIMQKVGLSKAEIRSSIRSQILMMFFLPLAASGDPYNVCFSNDCKASGTDEYDECKAVRLVYGRNLRSVRRSLLCGLYDDLPCLYEDCKLERKADWRQSDPVPWRRFINGGSDAGERMDGIK